jgi:multiple sugar transport system permease protein
MLLYLAALQSIPQEYNEAASLDGAGGWDRFRSITWHMLGPTTFFIVIVNLINGFQEGFQQAHIMTQGGPAGSTTVLSYYIYNQAYIWNHMGYAAAISWILFLFILAITVVSWKSGNRTVHYR